MLVRLRKRRKGKGHPRTGHEVPEVEYRYSSTLSLISALDGVVGQRHAPAALPPGKTRYPLYRVPVVPKCRLDKCEKSRPHRDLIPGLSSPYRVAVPSELFWPKKTNYFYAIPVNFIHSFSFSSLSYDRSKASSKASFPHSAIQSFLLQMRVSSSFLTVIQ